MTMASKTSLYDLHIRLDAKMVEFADHLLPIQFPTGIIKEVMHCRRAAGLFDISHMGQIALSLQAVRELSGLLASDVSSCQLGQQIYSVLTNQQGGIIDDVILSHLPSSLLLVVNGACKDKDYQHLSRYLSPNCELKQITSRALLALQGPLAAQVIHELCPEACEMTFMKAMEVTIHSWPCIISRSGYTGEDGFEIAVSNEHAEALASLLLSFEAVKPIGLGARDILRLEAGLSLYGQELSETISPVEAGLSWLLDKKGDFLGADIIASQLASGPARRKVALLVDGKIPVRAGTKINNAEGREVGFISSGAYSPTLNKPIALALIESGESNTKHFFAQIRQHQIRLQKTKLPFVEHRYHRG